MYDIEVAHIIWKIRHLYLNKRLKKTIQNPFDSCQCQRKKRKNELQSEIKMKRWVGGVESVFLISGVLTRIWLQRIIKSLMKLQIAIFIMYCVFVLEPDDAFLFFYLLK